MESYRKNRNEWCSNMKWTTEQKRILKQIDVEDMYLLVFVPIQRDMMKKIKSFISNLPIPTGRKLFVIFLNSGTYEGFTYTRFDWQVKRFSAWIRILLSSYAKQLDYRLGETSYDSDVTLYFEVAWQVMVKEIQSTLTKAPPYFLHQATISSDDKNQNEESTLQLLSPSKGLKPPPKAVISLCK